MSSSPTPPVPPAAKAQAKALTIKEQRAEARSKKLEEYKKREARARRNRLIGIWSAVAGAVVVVALVVSAVVLTPQRASYTAGGTGAKVSGVETFNNGAGHVEGTVDYPQNPPAGGEHNQMWLNCGVYDQPVPNENAVHSLEHGAIWVTYDPSLSEDALNALKLKLPSSYIVLSPKEDLPSTIVLSGWNSQLQVDSADDARIGEFLEEYWKSQFVPEPGALCSGAFDAPGKVS
ncbi:DUF3105 domain-containing protein [Microterricola viridarii]|uniref:DUF3105 domain-containing protein n=1 Tax=Microterricola viridarii TaxID=412690 RepID=A0A0X8E525_9MICO|nr:DUF3105 domain-containing protein [Microterricola viridarii]AMB59563.1 hypothetical protein AWU67_12575 [Microterricola viridarii]